MWRGALLDVTNFAHVHIELYLQVVSYACSRIFVHLFYAQHFAWLCDSRQESWRRWFSQQALALCILASATSFLPVEFTTGAVNTPWTAHQQPFTPHLIARNEELQSLQVATAFTTRSRREFTALLQPSCHDKPEPLYCPADLSYKWCGQRARTLKCTCLGVSPAR